MNNQSTNPTPDAPARALTPGPRPPGRPRALDDVKRGEFIALVTAGWGIQTAARYVGVSTRTVHRELIRNKQFWDEFRRAEHASRLEPLDTVRKAVKHNWRAAAWMLERKSPRDFQRFHPRMIDPMDVEEMFDRIFHVIKQSIPDPHLREKALRRIGKAMNTELHELPTHRRSPRNPKRAKPRHPQDFPPLSDPFHDHRDDSPPPNPNTTDQHQPAPQVTSDPPAAESARGGTTDN
jgi:hypothetical protein